MDSPAGSQTPAPGAGGPAIKDPVSSAKVPMVYICGGKMN